MKIYNVSNYKILCIFPYLSFDWNDNYLAIALGWLCFGIVFDFRKDKEIEEFEELEDLEYL